MPHIGRGRRRVAGLGRFLAPFTNHTPHKGKIGHCLVRFEPDANCTNQRHEERTRKAEKKEEFLLTIFSQLSSRSYRTSHMLCAERGCITALSGGST